MVKETKPKAENKTKEISHKPKRKIAPPNLTKKKKQKKDDVTKTQYTNETQNTYSINDKTN